MTTASPSPRRVEPSAFLAAGGEMGSRIAAFDWRTTSVGPIADWPLSLRHTVGLMLASPVPMVLLWGEAGVMIYNDAYSGFAGGRDSRLLGSAVREGWDEVADFNDHVMREGLAGRTLSFRDHELTLHRHGRPEQVWMNLDYSPVTGEEGLPAGVIAVVVETTEAVQTRRALEGGQRRLEFLDDLGRAVVACRRADDILAITTRLTAEHLGLSNCAYADMDADGDGFTVRGNWHAPGSPSIVGHYRLADFGGRAVADLSKGRPLIINDVQTELPPEEAQAFNAIGVAATICMPLLQEGKLIALMAIHDARPHVWSDYELSIIREVTERSWAHIQRVGVEGVLREHESFTRQILDSAIDYGIVATDMEGRVTLWNEGAHAMLGWTEAEMLGQPIALCFTEEDRAGDRPATKRQEALDDGRAHDARWHIRKSGARFWGLSEMTPLRNQQGDAVGFVKLMRDRTAEHESQTALQASRELLQRAEAAGAVGLFSLDFDTEIIRGSSEFCRLFGLPAAAEIEWDRIRALIRPEDRGQALRAVEEGGDDVLLDVEYVITRADTGETRILACKGAYERDADGRALRLVGAVQDISERRQVEQALQDSQARFSALAQNLPNQVWTAKADGSLDWFNDRVYAYCGATPGSLDGSDWTRIVHPDDLPAAGERWAISIDTGGIYETEFRLRDATGAYRWHLARAMPLFGADGRIAAWVGTNTEIEAQKQAEAAHAQDRDRLWTISQDLMLVCDFAGTVTAVNPSAGRLLGWQEDEMVGKPLSDFLHPDDLRPTAQELAKLSQGATTLAFENRYRKQDGAFCLLSWTAVPDGGRIHAVGRDITQQRLTEDALRQSQKMEAVGQLTGGIAHDFNNLLQGIIGSLDIMQGRVESGRTDDLLRWVAGAKGSAERAAALTHRLLAFSRRQPLDPRPVRANPLISSTEEMLRRTLGDHIQLALCLSDDLWRTRCDPNQLESAILNLAINARDAMPDGGALEIRTENVELDAGHPALPLDAQPGCYVAIRVADTGTGMNEDIKARAFEPFFTTKPTGKGTGLGLSMIYGFTRQSEGFAGIESEAGKGTAVILYLPRFDGAEAAEPGDIVSRDLPGSDSSEVVLVVEDEPLVRSLIVEVLQGLGYEALEAEDGPSGLAILESPQRIDLLVTDIGLPGLNGRQVADAARQRRPDLRILFMTGYAENAALPSGFLEPGMEMLTKPFAIDVLATRIRGLIEHEAA